MITAEYLEARADVMFDDIEYHKQEEEVQNLREILKDIKLLLVIGQIDSALGLIETVLGATNEPARTF